MPLSTTTIKDFSTKNIVKFQPPSKNYRNESAGDIFGGVTRTKSIDHVILDVGE